jgi:DNA-binding MarR family transcriptional regulator
MAAESDTSAEIAELEEQVSALMRQANASVRLAALQIDPTLPPFGFKMLRMLSRCGAIHASAVADRMDVDRSIISRQTKQLEELGLVECRVDPEDGRARYLAVTPLAVERMHAAGLTGRTKIQDELHTWSAEDLQRFTGYIARLNVLDANG